MTSRVVDTSVEVWFETFTSTETVAHIRSADGVLGHAAEVKDRIPVGAWLVLQPALHRLGPYLVAKCGFVYMGTLKAGDEMHALYRRL